VSEREQAAPTDDEHSQQQWESTPLANVLNTEAAIVHDVAFGDGYALALGQPPATHIEIFPKSQTVRVTTSAARVELFCQAPPTTSAASVVFTQEHAAQTLRLTLAPSGEVDLAITPATPQNATESPTMPTDTGVDRQEPFREETGGGDNFMPIATLSEQGTPSTEDSPEKQQRITIAGRVGKAPHLRTTNSGRVVASFPVAVHNDDGTTTWHTVVAFDARAKKLQETVASGQSIEVIGYLHEREAKTKGGNSKMVQEVYAAVVKSRT
jgi:hypothetical protein